MSQEAIHVLLVEDNPDHAELIQRVLKRQQSVASVTAVTRGAEGLQMLSQNSYSVVLLDYSLPGMDGLMVLKEIRRRGCELPVVMVTSQGVERVAVEAMQEGASDYLIKAAGYLTTLPTMLSKVLKQHQLQMENLRLFDETRTRAQEQAALNAIAMAVSQSLEADELLRIALNKLLEVTRREQGYITLKDPVTGAITLAAHQGLSAHFIEELERGRTAGGKSDQVFESGRSLVVNDPAEGRMREAVVQEGIQGMVLIPLRAHGKVAGVLNVSTCQKLPFAPREVELLESIGNVIGVALENARLYAEATRRHREAETLGEVGRLISQSLHPQEVQQRIVESLRAILDTQNCVLFRHEPASGDLIAVAFSGEKGDRFDPILTLPRGTGMAGLALRERHPVATTDLLADLRVVFTPELRARFGQAPFRSSLSAPLVVKDRVIGALSLGDRPGRVFNAQEIQLTQSFADQAGVALENARLYEETEQRRREAEELGGVSRTLTESLDVSAVGQRIVEGVLPLFAPQTAVVWLVQPDNSLIVLASTGPASDLLARGSVFPPGVGLAGIAIAEGRPARSSDVLSEDNILLPDVRRRLTELGSTAVLAVPLRAKGKTLGVLAIRDRTGRVFSNDEVALLEAFAAQGALALENARLYEETERRRREAEELGRVSRTLAESLDVSTVGERIVQGVVPLFAAQTAVVWLVQPDNSMVVLASTGPARDLVPRGDVFPPGVGLAGRAIAESQSVWSSDILSQDGILIPDDRRRRLADSGSTAVLAVPLSVKGKTIGALATLDRTGRVFSNDEVALLEAFAAQGALALENARLFDEVRRSYEDLRQTQEHLVRGERLRALGEMAGGVAHDFNNLLAVILGRAQYLKMGLSQLSPEAVTRSLGIIEQSARDGAETVRHLFEFTRGVPSDPPGPVNINEVVTEAVAASEPRWKDEAEARGITVLVETDLGAIRPALGNASQLREALLNLIFNGVEAMPEGGRLSLATWDDDRGVWLRVADQGTGMEDEVRRRVFEPFFTTKGPQRSGLGLSMVYGIITHHGGTITIEESEGKGTAFLIRLPQSEVPKPASVTSPVPAVPASTVLVIDDEEGVREILADILGSTGHTVVLAASGSEGLEWVERQPFDLICTDLGMPGMSGWQVVEGVKALRPEAPVALITGWGAQIRPEELSAHHADFLLTKPFQISEVLTTLAEARALRNGERANGG